MFEEIERIKTIAVIGGGTMGSGIAQVAAQAGLEVILYDISEQALEKAKKTVYGNLDRLATKPMGGISTIQRDVFLERIHTTTDLGEVAKADFVVEAATEKEELKLQLFQDLDTLCRPNVILASNTSSIAIAKLAAGTNRPGQVIGMHFMNPVPVMKLVEVVVGRNTNSETIATVLALAKKLGKVTVEVSDSPGFVVNRILIPMINEAIICLDKGIADAKGIDTCMLLGTNQPIGPLALADLIGLDVCLAIMEVLHHDLNDDKYQPAELLVKLVAAGRLGKKTGEGFYAY